MLSKIKVTLSILLNLRLPDMKSEVKQIWKNLAKGDVVAHHSKHYEETYHPHYRIVHRTVFERWRELINSN